MIAGLAVGTVLLLVLTMVPALQVHVQALARWTSLATLGVVAVKLFDEPGANMLHEPRHGTPDRARLRDRARGERDDRRRGAATQPPAGQDLQAAADARVRARQLVRPAAV